MKSIGGKTILKDAGIVMIALLLILSSLMVTADIKKSENTAPFLLDTNTHDATHQQTNHEVGTPCAICNGGWLYYYYTNKWVGFKISGGATWEAAIRLTPTELAPYCGCRLTAVQFYHWDANYLHGNIKIYRQGTPTTPGQLLCSQPYFVNDSGWFVVTLSTPVPFNCTEDLWISVEMVQDPDEIPIGFDSGPAVDGKGDWYNDGSGSGWIELQSYGSLWDRNWLIEAYIDCGSHLIITKTDNLNETDCVWQCEYINYTICTSAHASTQHNVIITDQLPNETGFIDASPGYNISSRTVRWDIGTIIANSTKCVWLLVLVRPETANGTIIHNMAFATSDENSSAPIIEDTPVCGECCFYVNITGGPGYHIYFYNICNKTLTNVPWSVTITGGLILLGAHKSGMIPNFLPYATESINGFVLGIGKITMTIVIDDCPPFIATAKLFLFSINDVQLVPHLSCRTCGQ